MYGEPVDNESDDVTDTEWDGSGSGDGECKMHHAFIFQKCLQCGVQSHEWIAYST